jgi:hypothetical protein
MKSERRTILQLLAAGRISSGEAERLLAAASADRESLWVLAGCAVFTATQAHAFAVPMIECARTILAWSLPALQHALGLIASTQGGRL